MAPRILLYCLIGGLPFTIAGLGAGHAAWWWLAGIALAASFVPVAIYGPRGRLAQFGVIAPALFTISVFCLWTETLVFMPQLRAQSVSIFVGTTVMYMMVAAAVALLAPALGLARPSNHDAPHRPALGAAAMVVVCGLAYAMYYLIFGAITYEYFTRGFYPDAPRQVAELGVWFWPLQIGRGILMTLGILPIVYTLRMPRGHAALAVGAIVWVAGGLAPLLAPSDLMTTAQRIFHIVEIFTQNVSLGVTVVLLMRPGASRVSSSYSRIGARP
jgi:hypothetical protein